MAETSEFHIHLKNGKETLCNNYLEYLHIWINGKIITLKQMKHTLWSNVWTKRTFGGFDVLTATTMNNTIFCELVSCSPAEPHRRFQGTYWLQARRCNQFRFPTRWWISTGLDNFTSPKSAPFLSDHSFLAHPRKEILNMTRNYVGLESSVRLFSRRP